jgi:hypothetical protein
MGIRHESAAEVQLKSPLGPLFFKEGIFVCYLTLSEKEVEVSAADDAGLITANSGRAHLI